MEKISAALMAVSLRGQSKDSAYHPFKLTFKHPEQDLWSVTRYCSFEELEANLNAIKTVGLIYRYDYFGKVYTNDI